MICGEPLEYTETLQAMHCMYCGAEFRADVHCSNGHFVCDRCHSAGAFELTEQYCNTSTGTDPFEMAIMLMHSPQFKMHGPEHHYLVPAVLIAAYYNQKNDPYTKRKKLAAARKRSERVPGGFCGSHGNCGAGVGTGIFFSLVTDTTPLSGKTWQLSNMLTGTCLLKIAEKGGPRCCKRDTYTALTQAVEFIAKHLGIHFAGGDDIRCDFHDMNNECLALGCEYFPG